MKQLLFLLLFPSLALAQYQGNANQKITLGEQTTADGLVWRGLRADTTSKIVPFSDTSAYIILDTVEKTLWLYKAGQIPKWQQVGGSTLDTATMLLPYYRAGRNTIIQAADVPTLNQNTTGSAATLTTGRTIQTNLASTSAATFNGSANITPGVTGTLPVANGGTNTSTAFTAGSVVFAGASGTYSQDNSNLFWDNTNKRLGIGTTSPTFKLDVLSSSTPIAKFTGSTNAYVDFTDGIVNTRLQNSGGLFFGTTTNNDLTLRTNAVARLTITSGGNVGIGTTSPSGVLEVAGTSANTDFRISRTVSSSTYFYIKAPGGSPSTATMGVNGVDVMALNASGNVGIGTISPAVQFHTTGGVRFAGLASITDLRTDANGDLFNGSDFNLKNSIDTINFGLSDVLKLKPVSFNWNDEQRNINEYKSMGFIAQDVMNIIPNAASTMGDGDMQVDYNAIVATLTKAIQEQNALIKALEQRISNLENK